MGGVAALGRWAVAWEVCGGPEEANDWAGVDGAIREWLALGLAHGPDIDGSISQKNYEIFC